MGDSNTKLSVKTESSDSEAEEETKRKTSGKSGDEEGMKFLQWQYGELRKEDERLKREAFGSTGKGSYAERE